MKMNEIAHQHQQRHLMRSELNSDVGKLLRQHQLHTNNNNSATNDNLNLSNNNCKSVENKELRDYNSSSGSDISEDVELSTVQDVVVVNPLASDSPNGSPSEEKEIKENRRIRSMSDGSPNLNGINPDGELFEVFPSLPDSVLEKLGLNGCNKLSPTSTTPKERLNDEELEQKFISLSLAFTIDAATIKNRCARQRRCRDQTEANLNAEIERLIEKAHRLRPLCVDAETTELLTTLLAHIDVIVRAADHAAIAAERYGAVQHEDRLADSVQLMINHVHHLKQQRDSARRQLQYTKRVLQDTNVVDASAINKQRLNHLNGPHHHHHQARLVTRRRASIATISQSQTLHSELQQQVLNEMSLRKITRRTSELTLRGSVLRGNRPARLELGLDLVQIRENTVEDHHQHDVPDVAEEIEEFADVPCNNALEFCDDCMDDSEALAKEQNFELTYKLEQEQLEQETILADAATTPVILDFSNFAQFKSHLTNSMRKVGRHCGNTLAAWLMDENANGNFFYFCALLCFSLSIISLTNVLVEMEYEKREVSSFFYWLYNT